MIFRTIKLFCCQKSLCATLALLLIVISFYPKHIEGADHVIGPAQWNSAVLSKAKPGDRYLLKPGKYNTPWVLENPHGTSEKPIAIASLESSNVAHIQLTASGGFLTDCGHLSVENLRIDGNNVALLVSNIERPKAGDAGTLVLDSVTVRGSIEIQNLSFLKMKNCKIKRDTGWRWKEEIVKAHNVRSIDIETTEIESLGMHNYLLSVAGCRDVLIEQCKFLGNFQRAIRFGPNSEVKTHAAVTNCLFIAGHAAIETGLIDELKITKNVLLNQKRSILFIEGKTKSNRVNQIDFLFSENLIVHKSYELNDFLVNKQSTPNVFSKNNCFRNMWYCQDRVRLNPNRFESPIMSDSLYGIRPRQEILEGLHLMDTKEIDRIKSAFSSQQRRYHLLFYAYMVVLLAFLALLAINIWTRRNLSDGDFSSVVRVSSLSKMPSIWALVAGLLVCTYGAARLSPFLIVALGDISIAAMSDRWKSNQKSNSSVSSLLLLAGISFIINAVLLKDANRSYRSKKKFATKIGMVVACCSCLCIIDFLDFFLFGGYSPPSMVRILAILLGAILALTFSWLIPTSVASKFSRNPSDTKEFAWIDLTAIGAFTASLLYAWFPFDFLLDPRNVYGRFKGEFVLLEPFTLNLGLVNTFVIVWHGFLVALAINRFFFVGNFANRKALGWTVLYLIFVEAIKLMIPGKVVSMDVLLLGVVGAGIAGISEPLWRLSFGGRVSVSSASGQSVPLRITNSGWFLLPLWIEIGLYYFWKATA